jgi:hypothetical protein
MFVVDDDASVRDFVARYWRRCRCCCTAISATSIQRVTPNAHPDGETGRALMRWFYTRDRDSLCLETRYDKQTLEYVGILTHPDGHEDTRRFATARAFRNWLVSLDTRLMDERWAQDGAPHILPDGGPDATPPQ